MAELNVPIYDFRHGVLSPKLKDRPNLELYKSGVLTGENFLSSLHGPTEYRPGFIHSRTTRRNNIAHFIPFTFADDEAYILSFTEGYMRIFTDDGAGNIGVLTEDPFDISGITQADPGVVTAVGHDFVNGDEVFIDDITGMTELNGQFYLVANVVTPGTSERNWPFSVPGNYTYNAADIEVSAGNAHLKLSGSATDFPFTIPGNYTYPAGLEIVAGEVALVDLSPTDSTFYANYNTDISGTWGSGVLAGVATGGAAVAGGELDLIYDDLRYVTYSAVDNADMLQTGCVRMLVRPNYTGSPATVQIFVSIFETLGLLNNLVQIQHQTSGDIRYALVDSAGVVITAYNAAAWAPTSGVQYEIEINWDITTGASRIFIDGVQQGVTQTDTGTRDAANFMRVGTNYLAAANSNFAADDLILYSTVQHTANYTPGAAIPQEKYGTDDPTIVNNTGLVFASAFNAFLETSTEPVGANIRYQLSSDDGTTWEWWNGAAWVARSTGTSQIIASAINTITGTLDAGNLASIQTLDASTYDVSEVGGVPGFDIEIDFDAISGPPDQITIYGYYAGNPVHVVNVDIWNYDTLAWDTLGTIPSTGGPITQYNFAVTGTKSDYVDGTDSKMRIYHATTGSPAHDIFIDYVYVLATPTDSWYYTNEATDSAGVNTNIATLAASGTFKFNAFMHSDTGAATPVLDLIQVGNIAYALTDPTIETNSGFPFTAVLADFTETSTKPANTEIQYIVSIDDGVNYLWWSGAAWVASNGTYAESNLASVVDTNIAALGAVGTFKFKAFLHTTDIAATPELDNIHTEYTVLPSDTFSLTDQDGNDIDTTTFDAYISDGTAARVFEIASPYATADLPQLKFAQKSDIMYIDHPTYAPRKLTRFGDGSWTLTPYIRVLDPFEQANFTNVTQASPGVVTSSTRHGLLTGDQVRIEDVVGMTELNQNIYTITFVTEFIYSIGVDTSAFTPYVSGGVSLKVGNAPAGVGFYGGRVFHGGSENDPDLLFGSKSSSPTTGATQYEDFTISTDVDSAVVLALTSASTTTTDRIRFFMGTRQFLATGTFAGMLKVNGGADSIPISASAIESFPVDNNGVADIMPVYFGTDIIYIQRGQEVMYSFKFNFLNDGYQSEDVTLQSDEITNGGIVQITYQQGNPNRVWAAMADGRLLSLTYNPGEEVSAWNNHPIGDDGIVLSVAAQPQADNRDRVWIAVERIVDGVTRRYVEYMAKNPRIPERTDFYSGPTTTDEAADDSKFRNLMFYAQKRQIHLDSALTLDTTQSATITPAAVTGSDISFTASESLFSAGDLNRKIQIKYNDGTEQGIAEISEYVSETEVKCLIQQDFASTDPITGGNWYFTQNTISGLGHLEGKTVAVVGDGGIQESKVVVNGEITLNSQVTYAMIGLAYFGRLQTMPLELLLSTGITPGKYKSVNKVNLMFRNSLGVSYGYKPYEMEQIAFREGVQYVGRPPILFNGVKERPGFDDYGEQRTMWVVQTLPYPCTVNAMVFDMEFSEEN